MYISRLVDKSCDIYIIEYYFILLCTSMYYTVTILFSYKKEMNWCTHVMDEAQKRHAES